MLINKTIAQIPISGGSRVSHRSLFHLPPHITMSNIIEDGIDWLDQYVSDNVNLINDQPEKQAFYMWEELGKIGLTPKEKVSCLESYMAKRKYT